MNTIISTTDLTRRFGDTTAVDRLNLTVEAGEIFGFLGHNGAGKTTTVRLFNGILTPSEGNVRVLGMDPVTQGAELRRHTGVLTETPSLDERLSGRESLTIYADLYGVPVGQVKNRVEALLGVFELADRGEEKVGGYSKGMKQRLALARALIHAPELLFLDEPSAGLDPAATRRLHDLILRLTRSEGRTVFLCTHNLDEAQRLCHRVAVLEKGRMIALGTPAELARQVGGVRKLEITVGESHITPALALLNSRPGLSAAAHEMGTLTITGAPPEAVPDLVAALVAAQMPIYRVASQEPTLEDVYFALQDRRLESEDQPKVGVS